RAVKERVRAGDQVRASRRSNGARSYLNLHLGITTMRIHLGLGLFAFTLTELVAPGLAEAATANCMSPDGACEVSNDAGDWIMCSCADGSGGGGGGGNEWDGLTEMELE